MKTTFISITVLALCLELTGGCVQKSSASRGSIENPEVVAQLKMFAAVKETQANAATNRMPAEFKAFFAAAEKSDWLTMSNLFQTLLKRTGQISTTEPVDLSLRGAQWEIVKEIWGAFDAFFVGDKKYSASFGQDIIESIPPGSIYFGGTDPGRFIVSALCKSQALADPFFTLTQNALLDSSYLDYLRSIYGGKIYVPTDEDAQKCFENYTQNAQRRMQNHQLKPGEDVQVTDGRVQVCGIVAVMEINGLAAKIIFDQNPGREFFIEEGFPLEWTYPHLEPHGLIFKINRQPLTELSEAVVKRDHDYWVKTVQPMIGGWLHTDTSLKKIAGFAKKVFLQHDYRGFTGDPRFIQNEYSSRIFSWERASIAGLYVWRMNHAVSAEERERMADEADFAFRQALALCPSNSETAKSYGDFLKSRNRDADAALLDRMVKQFPKGSKS